jgi:small-conductance mechanosensitive channel
VLCSMIVLRSHRNTFYLAFGLAAWHAPASAQETVSQSAAPAESEQPTAPVVLDGVTLFRVRGFSAFPAEHRAAGIIDRITALAADQTIPADSIVLRETQLGSEVVAGGQRLFGVVDADAELEGVPRQVLADTYRNRVVEAIQRFRHDREGAVLWPDAARALGAILVLVLGLWLARRALRLIRVTLGQRYRHRLRHVQVGTVEIVRAEHLWQGLERAISIAAWLAALVAAYITLNYVLLLFPWTRALGNSLSAILLEPLATIGKGILRYIPDLVFLVILALITRYVLKLVRLFFSRVSSGIITLSAFEPGWARPTDRIVRVLVIAFALIVAYPHIPGSGTDAFKGVSILFGLLFSLGSPSVISNMVAGQSLAYRRTFKVGDRIRVGQHIGDVAQMRLLTTYLRTPKNEVVVIPNQLIINTEVVNYSTLAGQGGVILHSIVGIGYETPWRQVEAMLLEAAARTPGLQAEPRPFVLQKTLGTFAVDYEINAYCDNPQAMFLLYTALHRNILDVFNEHDVQIMTPAYEGDPAAPKVVPREQWYAAPADGASSSNGPKKADEVVPRVVTL